jgi:hypothetical protein
MLTNLALGLPTMILCLFLQAFLLVVVVRRYTRQEFLLRSPSIWSSIVVVKGIMLLLVIGNLAQVAIWAVLFMLLGEFSQFSEAFYHSAVNFATLGYGDFVMSDGHKLLGPLESINGILMIGVSTAILMSGFQDAMRKTVEARQGRTPIE